MTKKVSIYIATFALSFWFWVVVKNWFNGDVLFVRFSAWFWPVTLMIVLAAVLALAYLVLAQEQLKWKWALAWIVGLTYLLVFGFAFNAPQASLWGFWGLKLAVLLAILGGHLIAIHLIKTESNERVKLNVGLALRRGMPALMVPLLLGISFSYYQSAGLQERLANLEEPTTFRSVITKTVDNFLGVGSINEAREAASITKQELSDQIFAYGRDAFYAFTEKYNTFVPPILAFGLFVLLWGVSFVFIWLSVWLAMLLFWILKVSHVVTIQEVDTKAQRLIF